MNAKKCDRCGQYYNPYPGQDCGVGSKANRIALQDDFKAQCAVCFDLCPACMERQIQFLQGDESNEQSDMVRCKDCNAYTETGPGTGVCPALGGVAEYDGCTMGDRKESEK